MDWPIISTFTGWAIKIACIEATNRVSGAYQTKLPKLALPVPTAGRRRRRRPPRRPPPSGFILFVIYFGQNVFYHVTMVPNAFLVLRRVERILLMSLGLAVVARKSTPPGVARARDALRDSGREGTIVARGGAVGFGAPALVPTVTISKPETARFAQFCAIESARHDVL